MLVSTSRCLHYTLHAHVVYLRPVSLVAAPQSRCPQVVTAVASVLVPHSVHTQESDTHGEGESDAVILPGTETQHSQYLGDMRLLSSEHLFIMSVDG